MSAPTGRAAVDVLIVSLGSTLGLRAADAELAGALERAGATVATAAAAPARALRTFALTDLAWAVQARRAAVAALARHRPSAIVYSTSTAAALWPLPGAIRFDAPAAGNRPGRHGAWQRPWERRRFAQAPLLIPYSPGALAEATLTPEARARAIVVPMSVEPSPAGGGATVGAGGTDGTDGTDRARGVGRAGEAGGARDLAAVTYVADARKKGLERILAAWAAARRESETLVVAGGVAPVVGVAGVRWTGALPAAEFRTLLRRARVYVAAPRREDYGQAQLEALADGCRLVTSPAPGPYAALPIARALDPRLVGDDLAAALRTALDDPAPDYAARARDALGPYRRSAIDVTVAERLLPALLG